MMTVAARERLRHIPAVNEQVPVGVREMVAIASKNRLKIALALLVPPALALALALMLPKAYRAESDLLVKTGREYLAQADSESSGVAAPSSTKQEGINSEIALLQSRSTAEAAIAAIGLGVLYPDLLAEPPSSGSVLDAAVLRFEKDLGVDPVKMSNIIATSFDAPTPELAKRVLDTVIRVYIDKHTELYAGRKTEGYRDTIDTTMREIQALEARRSTIKLTNEIYDIAAQRQALITQRVDAQTKLQDALNRQAKLQARLTYLNHAKTGIATTTVSTSTDKNDPANHVREALTDLRQQEAALSARLGNANPDLQRLRSQIDVAQHDADASSAQRVNTVTTASLLRQQVEQEIVMAAAELSTMQPEIDRLRTAVSASEKDLDRLERADLALRNTELQINVQTDNLKAMQGRYEQVRADEQTEIARQVSVVQVSSAIASEKPVKPKKLILGLGGVLGGVLAAGMAAMLTILCSRTAVVEEALERALGLPVLATVPVRRRSREQVTLGLQ